MEVQLQGEKSHYSLLHVSQINISAATFYINGGVWFDSG